MAPIDSLVERFSALGKLSLQHVTAAQKAPAISPTTAALLSSAFTVIYVAPFYLSAKTRPSLQLHRDAPSSIRARVRSVTFSVIVCFVLTCFVLQKYGEASIQDIVKLIGLWPISLVDTAKTMLLVVVLFAGPLFEAGIVEGGLPDWIRGSYIMDTFGSWVGYRNLVVGPVSEELIWRGMIIPLHILAGFSAKQMVFLTPLYFGIAHAHHLYDFRITNPRTPFIVGIARSVFQFTYTSLFGFFASFVFLRTGNVYSAILAHTFCNWMGLPRFWGRVGVEAGVPIGPPGDANGAEGQQDGSKGIGWTVAYYVILVAGAYGFYHYLFVLTDSSNAIAAM